MINALLISIVYEGFFSLHTEGIYKSTFSNEKLKNNFPDVFNLLNRQTGVTIITCFNRFAANSKSDETFFCAENYEPNF